MAAVLGVTGGVALAKESTYGTAVTTTRGLPVISESLTLDVARVESAALKGGGLLQLTSNVRMGPVMGSGGIQTYLFSTGATLLWEALLGSIGTQGSGPYTHTAKLGATLPSYSIDVGFGGLTSVMVKRVVGFVVGSWEIGVSLGEYVTLGLEGTYADESVIAAGDSNDDVAGTFPSGQVPFLAQEVAVAVDGTSYCLQSLTLSGNNTLKTEHCLGSRTINQPTRNGRPTISGSMTMKLDSVDTTLYDAFVSGDLLPLSIVCTEGSNTCTIAGTIRVDGTSPQLSGQEEIMVDYPFVVEVDDENSDDDDDAFSVVVVNGDATP